FLEPIGNSTYNGLWAEVLENPSLEENLWNTAHIEQMLRDQPELADASRLGLPLPWKPLDPRQENRYEAHWGNAANSWRSLEVIGVPGEPTGIAQRVYLPIHRELKYEGSLWAKHLLGPATLTIQIRRHNAPEVIASATVTAAGTDWAKYPFTFEIPQGKLQRLEPADFVVLVDGEERIDLDNINLFPADALKNGLDGLDPDEVKMAREMHTPLVRFGGNFTSGYHWKDGIGPADKRVSMLNIAWGIPEYNTFGTDEFLNFCKLIGAEPQVAVNLGSGTAQVAAEWVKYVDEKFNHSAGGLHWELGNELWGGWNLGAPTLEQLPGRTKDVSEAIRAVDPKAKLIATGQDPDHFEQWNAAQLTNPAGTFDELSTHFVVTTDQTVKRNPSADFLAQATFALPVQLGRQLRLAQQQIDANPAFAHKAHIAFTEWLFNGRRPDAPRYSNMAGALAAAGLLNMLMENADVVPISDMTGIMEFAGIWKKRSQVYATPAYYAFQMYAAADATTPVTVTSNAGSYAVKDGITRLPNIADVSYLDIVAAKNDAGDTLTLFVVNRHLTRDMATDVDVQGFAASGNAQVKTLDAPSLYNENTEMMPQAVVPKDSAVAVKGGRLHTVFPHESVTVITLRKS
ncbi:alpha-L-arabinofuranosidase C-terminal domain-containing protein, partial [Silvibacterium sp.]|uniref:alpha-L-arabinofuranosidase C-terminal domain-containing protein n=1 Tax=Silvibacterium sp. TaxID=1964179 RepID=UPI0039E438D1